MNDLTVLVLAGGEGKRFWPFTTNKLVFPFSGKPLLEYTVRNMLPKGDSQVVIVTSPDNNELFHSYTTVVQEQAKGMADAIRCAKSKITTKKLLILIADDIYDSTLPQQILDTAEKTQAFGVIPGWQVKTYFPGGYLNLAGKRISSIVEKPDPTDVPSDRINISGHYIADTTLLFAALDKVTSGDDQYEQAISLLMMDKEFVVHEYNGVFASLKYPWHVLDMMDEILPRLIQFKGSNCEIKQNVFIEGPVYIGNNVRIFENTKIVGPVYIGDNTIIGNNNVIRHSMLGDNCVTGFNTDITRSYIGDSCWFHSNYIGDSVLEGNVSMGSGSVLANLRLDEGEIMNTKRTKLGAMIGKNVRIGVNTSTMPGIKIGKDSMIGAGITVAQDIPDNSFVTGSSDLKIKTNVKKLSGDRSKYKTKL